ncbi:hypothetical protein SLS62_009542 [Diatrype stigma]|uniref:Small ribosomal subunit protein mS38 n=1 Tax=Diatrype stigma TaxID=117547 RepID=A0AAN9UG18_9PEZI
MLPSSMRRVVSSTPQSTFRSSLAPSTSRTSAAALAFTSNPRCQQRRRYSSSKPSSPKDSPKGVPDDKITAAPASTKQGGEKRRRKSNKDNADSNQHKLPSVPSTQHVPDKSMALSTFFSLHRPMSVTHSFPKTVTDDIFAKIFTPLTKDKKVDDVISTLSSTVDQLEDPMRSMSLEAQQDSMAATDANGEHMKIEVRHADGSESNVYVQLNAMSGQFLPFRPPPAPQSATEAAAAAVEGAQNEQAANAAAMEAFGSAASETRIYKAVFTLEETVEANGSTRIVAHTPQLIEEGDEGSHHDHDGHHHDGAEGGESEQAVPRTFLERMALREIRREEAQQRRRIPGGMAAISVRRQRKLKMKKKKYKKLMRRTRNERRKLDRV